MADSSDSVSIDMEMYSPRGKEHLIRTSQGIVSVSVFGDPDKPALVTYPDLALNSREALFRKLTLIRKRNVNTYYYVKASQICHVSKDYSSAQKHILYCSTTSVYITLALPGTSFQEALQLGAATMSPDDPVPSVDDLADQVAEVLNFFGLGAVMCMGVTAGAYILTLFAMKYKQRVIGLILVSPLCTAPSWTEWLLNKVMSNLLYFYGMCGVVKELLLKRYFSKELRGCAQVPESDIVQACRRLLDERQSSNVWRFLEAINGRPDISEGLRKLQCRSLIFIGEHSPFHSEAVHMTSKMDRRCTALVEVQACGTMVTEEQPHAMLIPIEYFLMGYGLYKASKVSVSPRSPLSPSCISPDLLSPESMGLKLKPIKTRIPFEV